MHGSLLGGLTRSKLVWELEDGLMAFRISHLDAQGLDLLVVLFVLDNNLLFVYDSVVQSNTSLW